MTYHSDDGLHFLGFRTDMRGAKQVVYDNAGRQRVILNVDAPDTLLPQIDRAMRAAVTRRNVFTALLSELSNHQIGFDYSE
ncbi:MAG: hypothetical protein MRY67_02530 [Rhodovulum sp.]|jgi:hypothetical protein|nr:hypothetical protein [Rhodovulum sp.]|tara:strand:- start:457 stop:699 length:243 start_codon:yes stop_codon:yes gene_type:complete